MTPTDTLLAALAGATSQRPVDEQDLAQACALPAGKFQVALQGLLADRRICSCRVIRGDQDSTVYWPTGIVNPVLSPRAQAATGRKPLTRPTTTPAPAPAPKPTRPKEAVMKPETNTAKLMMAIQQHGPLCVHDLAERTNVPTKNVDSSLAGAVAKGNIVTRRGYVAERGKELKLYMTPAQAKEWDEKSASAGGPVKAADGSATKAPAETEITAFLLRKDQPADEVAGLKRRLHDQANDLAAVRMILHAIRERLGLAAQDDGRILETLDARLSDHGQLGTPAIILLCNSCSRTKELEAALRCSENVRVSLRDRHISLMRSALERIASPTQTDGLLWWQIEAREALAKVGAGTTSPLDRMAA